MPMREADGEGIRIVFESGGDEFVAALEAKYIDIIEDIAEEMDIRAISPAVTKIEASYHGNDWEKQSKGEDYLARIKKRYGSRVSGTLEREHRRNIERVFDEELAKAEGRAAAKAAAEGVAAGKRPRPRRKAESRAEAP